MKKSVSRRTFLHTAALAATAAAAVPARKASARRVTPNDTIRLGMIGTGGMGSRHVEALCENPRCEIAAVCDVYRPRFEAAQAKVEELTGRKPDAYQDYRHLLDRKDIDAVFIATPDHWHPLLTIHGCQAGKDVYVEKPASPTVAEGRAMVETARRYGRVVQLGTQQRSMPVFQEAVKVLHSGAIGQITSATVWIGTNGWGVGETEEPVPEGLDWDLWLGPAPWQPFSMQRFGGFMGWHDYARGGQLTNWGVHHMDIVHWGIGEDSPLSVQALGGSYQGGAGSENFENIDAILEYKNCTVTWEQRHSNVYQNKSGGIKFQGTLGQLWVDRATFLVRPSSLGIEDYIGEPERTWANKDHHNNFFDCIQSRNRPAADIAQGVKSTIAVLLPGIALKAGRKLIWDGDAERFLNDEAANRHLARVYRAPWHL